MYRDSPTCSKKTLHILLALAPTKGWRIKGADVKNAYFQGEKLEREVCMEPPIQRKKENVIWKLLKSVHRINDAGRKWFLKLDDTLK